MKLAEFAAWCIAEGPWMGSNLDGGDVQEMAVKCGLLTQVAFDPAIHNGEYCDYVEPGDDWYVFSDEFKKLLGRKILSSS